MKKVYTVHSCHRTKVSAEAEIAGEKVVVVRDALVVEMVPDDKVSGTVKLTLTGTNATDEAEKMFAAGAAIQATFAPFKE